MKSAIYRGSVTHRRTKPVEHDFTYSMYMMYLDLAELDHVFKGRWLWSVEGRTPLLFKRRDHLGDPDIPLDAAVRDLVERRTGRRPLGPIRVLTNLRHFGYVFNPVSFYYISDEQDTGVETIVANITNTPWGEEHAYVVTAEEAQATGRTHHLEKEFHISPFMPMEMDYEWKFTEPDENLRVHMINFKGGERVFDAHLNLQRVEISGLSLAGTLARFPLMTLKVITGIYWQALRLKMKGAIYHPHPKTLNKETTRS